MLPLEPLSCIYCRCIEDMLDWRCECSDIEVFQAFYASIALNVTKIIPSGFSVLEDFMHLKVK